MRAALYIRASDTANETPDLEDQRGDLKALATAQGWRIAAEYVEAPHRARGPRKAFLKLIQAAARREFEVVLFWNLERFCPESLTATLHHLRTLISYGIDYRSFSEPFLDSTGPHRDAVIGTIALIAAHEHRRRGEKVREGLERANRKGRRGGRPRVVVDQERLYQMRLEDYSLAQIAAELGISKTTVVRLVRAQNVELLAKSGD